ncbi:MAG: ribonuclease HII [Candidatus Marsarchaeota archaeon]|nr:ribonuclease HII [Candidatus Marsarchaeota archaeon]
MISIVSVKKAMVHKLPEIGVRDSKLLSRKRRDELYSSILDIAEDVKIDRIAPAEINSAMKAGISLNELEAIHFAKLFDKFDQEVNFLYLDSPDVIAEKFGIRVNMLSNKPTKVYGIRAKGLKGVKYTTVVAEHKADSRYPVVSAASIMAKVERDRAMDQLSASLSIELGSGYPSDYHTIDAVRKNMKDKELSMHIREYWKTLGNIRQTKLFNFGETSA